MMILKILNLLSVVCGSSSLEVVTVQKKRKRFIKISDYHILKNFHEVSIMVLTVYKSDVSPTCRTVLMVVEALNIPNVIYVEVNLFEGDHIKDDYTKINPQQTIPTLTYNNFTIWDSHAIAAYLVNKYDKNDALYPADLKKRAVIDQRLHFDSGILYPAVRSALEPVLLKDEKAFKPEHITMLKTAYHLTEKILTKTWLAGDDITLADICCVSSVSSMDLIEPIDGNEYPKLLDWFTRCSQQEFYQKGNEKGLNDLRDVLKNKMA